MGEGKIDGRTHKYVLGARSPQRARENLVTAMQLLARRRGIENPRIEVIDVRPNEGEV